MSRRLAVVLLLVSVVAGCGIAPTEPFLYGTPPKSPVTGVQVYFRMGTGPFAVLRPGRRDLGMAERLDLLFAGPTEAERLAGIETAVPEGYRLAAPIVERAKSEYAVVVDRDGGAGLDVGATAGEQIACTMALGTPAGSAFSGALVVFGTSGREEGPYRCRG